MSNTTQSSARVRVQNLLDANSFAEIGAGVTARSTDFNMGEKKAPSDGVITGYGQIDGNPVYVYSQDAAVMNGSMGEMHARKIVNIYKMAMKTGVPVIGLIDCSGLRLEEATDSLHAFGDLYMAQTEASGVIPQITGIFGTCGGGMALVPALSDFTFMVEESAKLFVNAPNAIKGNSESDCDTSSAHFQAEETGLVDGIGTEAEVIAQIRALVGMLPANNEDDMSFAVCTDDENRISSELAACKADPACFLPKISDSGAYFEAQPFFGKDIVTAFIRLNGYTAGVVANRQAEYAEDGTTACRYDGTISARGARKGAEFVEVCDAFSIPVISFINVKGFHATMCAEKKLAKSLARLTFAFANATAPKISVVTGEAFGTAYLTMNSKATGADIVYAWEGAKIGMMDAAAAAKIMYDGCEASVITEKTAEYDALQNSAASAAARGYVDAVIDPAETRKYLIGALDMLFTKREYRPDKKHGTV